MLFAAKAQSPIEMTTIKLVSTILIGERDLPDHIRIHANEIIHQAAEIYRDEAKLAALDIEPEAIAIASNIQEGDNALYQLIQLNDISEMDITLARGILEDQRIASAH